MANYLKCFEYHSDYNTYITSNNKLLPNVSYCEDNNEVHYNKWVDTRLIAIFNIISTSDPILILNEDYISDISEIEIDGVILQNIVSEYSFSSTGEHTVKYTFIDSTIISSSCFAYCEYLTSIIIPTGVITIDDYAFSNCYILTNVTIPNTVTTIGKSAFYQCSGFNGGIVNLTIPDSVTTIGPYAFQYCDSLMSINIGSGITSIGDNAFSDCNLSKGCNIIINATTPPTLGFEPFDSIDPEDTKIYVPAESVNSYKADASWEYYIDNIESI